MMTPLTRVSRGIPAGGQFAADIHAEPTIDLSAVGSPAENLSRSVAEVTDLTPAQAERLLAKKTPIRDAMARRGVTGLSSMKETNDRIRSIQGRLNHG